MASTHTSVLLQLLLPPSSPHIPPSSSSSSSSSSCLDNITAYYFSYFHPSLCPYRPVSQAVMCDLELSLRLRVSSVGVRWLVYRDVTGGVTPNKPTSPSSPFLTPKEPPRCATRKPPARPLMVRRLDGRVLAPGGMWLMTISWCHLRFWGGGLFKRMCSPRCTLACERARVSVCVCVCVLMNVCILILSANQLLSRGADSCRHRRLLFHHHPSSLLRTSLQSAGWRVGGESGGSLSHGSCSLRESLHHCGTLSHTHMHRATHNLSPLSLSIYHHATTPFN